MIYTITDCNRLYLLLTIALPIVTEEGEVIIIN